MEAPGWIFIIIIITIIIIFIIIIIIIIIIITIIIIIIIITIITLEVAEKWEKRRLIVDSDRCAWYGSHRFYNFIKNRDIYHRIPGSDAPTGNTNGTSWFNIL